MVNKRTREGNPGTEPVFSKNTLAAPAKKIAVQSAGPIHIHPNGRFVYQGNRSGVAANVVPGVELVDGKKVFTGGASNIGAWAINPQTREPTAIPPPRPPPPHPRAFSP